MWLKVGNFYPATSESITSLAKQAISARKKAKEKGGKVWFKVGWEESEVAA